MVQQANAKCREGGERNVLDGDGQSEEYLWEKGASVSISCLGNLDVSKPLLFQRL